MSAVLLERWYVVVNDLIGGWSIANVDKPCSELVHPDECEIGCFISQDVAEHIVELHNATL